MNLLVEAATPRSTGLDAGTDWREENVFRVVDRDVEGFVLRACCLGGSSSVEKLQQQQPTLFSTSNSSS